MRPRPRAARERASSSSAVTYGIHNESQMASTLEHDADDGSSPMAATLQYDAVGQGEPNVSDDKTLAHDNCGICLALFCN